MEFCRKYLRSCGWYPAEIAFELKKENSQFNLRDYDDGFNFDLRDLQLPVVDEENRKMLLGLHAGVISIKNFTAFAAYQREFQNAENKKLLDSRQA